MKAQIAVEFIIIFGVFLIAVIVIALASWNNVANAEKTAVDFEAYRVLGMASDRINTAFLEGDGFSTGLVLPGKIGVHDYTIELDGNELFIHVNQASFSGRLLTDNVTGTLAKGDNTISNVNGAVVIS
jgi:hypothetical protein